MFADQLFALQALRRTALAAVKHAIRRNQSGLPSRPRGRGFLVPLLKTCFRRRIVRLLDVLGERKSLQLEQGSEGQLQWGCAGC